MRAGTHLMLPHPPPLLHACSAAGTIMDTDISAMASGAPITSACIPAAACVRMLTSWGASCSSSTVASTTTSRLPPTAGAPTSSEAWQCRARMVRPWRLDRLWFSKWGLAQWGWLTAL